MTRINFISHIHLLYQHLLIGLLTVRGLIRYPNSQPIAWALSLYQHHPADSRYISTYLHAHDC
ncbi:unnamed protein product [Meloidogyne enterolobii]|uniref:Uncharacterized protein n=1 Tax=Meloidogyne enterolobii TaxID=390850 RepID=A0ACB1AP17_MELEN